MDPRLRWEDNDVVQIMIFILRTAASRERRLYDDSIYGKILALIFI